MTIVTISGSPGSGKSTIADQLSEKLNLKRHSIGDFMREIADERNISLEELGKIAEKDNSVDKLLDKKQIEIGKKENSFVIDSRPGYHFIPNSIKIFLSVEEQESAKRIFNDKRKTENFKSIKDAIKKISQRKLSEKLRYKKYYNINYPDLKKFDLVIDTTNLTIEEITNKIIDFIKNKPSI